MSAEEHNISLEVMRRMRQIIPPEARLAYWQRGRGPMFVYNTERLRTLFPNDPGNGKFESAVFVPYGKGSRTGKANRWKVLDESRSLHELRKDAKDCAWRLYQDWLKTGKVNW